MNRQVNLCEINVEKTEIIFFLSILPIIQLDEENDSRKKKILLPGVKNYGHSPADSN
jgi:hypothetical protein